MTRFVSFDFNLIELRPLNESIVISKIFKTHLYLFVFMNFRIILPVSDVAGSPIWHQNRGASQVFMPTVKQERPVIDEKELELQVRNSFSLSAFTVKELPNVKRIVLTYFHLAFFAVFLCTGTFF